MDLTLDEMKKCLSDSGCCIAGQTVSLVPADRIMYATRDITGTVDNANFVTGIKSYSIKIWHLIQRTDPWIYSINHFQESCRKC